MPAVGDPKSDILCDGPGTGVLVPALVNHFQMFALHLSPSTLEDRMSDIAEKAVRAALVALVIPAALLAVGCSSPQPAPPPQQSVAPPPPPPPPPPVVRG